VGLAAGTPRDVDEETRARYMIPSIGTRYVIRTSGEGGFYFLLVQSALLRIDSLIRLPDFHRRSSVPFARLAIGGALAAVSPVARRRKPIADLIAEGWSRITPARVGSQRWRMIRCRLGGIFWSGRFSCLGALICG